MRQIKKITPILVTLIISLQASYSLHASNEDALLNAILRLEKKVDHLNQRLDAIEITNTDKTTSAPASDNSPKELDQVIQRLEKIEEQNKSLETLQMSLDTKEGQEEILKLHGKLQKAHAIKMYKWVSIENWEKLEKGQTEETVIEILGEPYKVEPSLHKRIDNVYFYQTDIDGDGKIERGKVKFYKRKLIIIEKPDLESIRIQNS